jgi:secondary thiamine-phosphate synthase enzyme
MTHQRTLSLRTRGRRTTEITAEIGRVVAVSGVRTGLCSAFLQHTSASLILCENADPSVRRDLETILARLAPGTWQGVYLWEHRHGPHTRQLMVTVVGE